MMMMVLIIIAVVIYKVHEKAEDLGAKVQMSD